MLRVVLLLLYILVLFQIAIEDVKYQKIRNVQIAKILLLSLAGCIWMPEIDFVSRILGMVAVSFPMFIINCIRPGSFGGGDLKLTFACGLFLGASKLIFGTIYGIFAAGVYAICLICKKRPKNTRFSLGPWLNCGYLIGAIWLMFEKKL